MQKQIIFRGVGSALITPFRNGEIDYTALDRIIELQIEAGVSALVIGGTTGEAATLTDEERYSLFRFAVGVNRGRVKLIFGTGTNDTAAAIRHTKMAESIGCDGVLVVTPYYNKGTREGLVKHYEAISDSTSLPIILYNVPSRTGVSLSSEQLSILKERENVVAIKEASDSLSSYMGIAAFGKELWLYAGNDSDLYSALSLGGAGVISVLSNLCPRLTVEICEKFDTGELERARELQLRALSVISALFCETNPAPIKYALMRRGLCDGTLRLPMTEVSAESRARIDAALDDKFVRSYLIV